MEIKPASTNSLYEKGLPYFNNPLTHCYESKVDHKYITFSENPRVGANTDAAFLIIEYFFGKKQSRKKWKDDKQPYNFNYTDGGGNPIISKSFNYLEVAKYIRENGKFDCQAYNLPEIKCFWLDYSLNSKINWHAFDSSAPSGLAVVDGVTKQQYGKKYPIVPRLIREGHSFTSLQPQLLHRITMLRNRLISGSERALTDEWVFDLRTLINDAVSIVEITLTQLHIKAEYDPLPIWIFNKEKLGSRYVGRFEEKLGWVYKISGKQLDADKYLPSFYNLKELRNHMMHFDPPSLIVTIEEATTWLNQIIDVGWLLVKIRQAIGVEVSIQLINFILQKEAIFNPEEYFTERLLIGTGKSDYKSSTWEGCQDLEESV